MAEIKTSPVTATLFADLAEWDASGPKTPGAFHVGEPDSDGERSFYYCCPCGCGRTAPLTVGENFKPGDGPSWNWNGSLERPTLTPSVHHVGHWHGWLTDGQWLSC